MAQFRLLGIEKTLTRQKKFLEDVALIRGREVL